MSETFYNPIAHGFGVVFIFDDSGKRGTYNLKKILIYLGAITSIIMLATGIVMLLKSPQGVSVDIKDGCKFYQYDTVTLDDLEVCEHDHFGNEIDLNDAEISLSNELLTGKQNTIDVTVTNEWGHYTASVEVNPIQVDEIECDYAAHVYEGDKFDQNLLTVTCKFADGTSKDIDEYTLEGAPDDLFGEDDVKFSVSTAYGTGVGTISVIPVDRVEMLSYSDLLQGDTLSNEDVSLEAVYTDGRRVDLTLTDDLTSVGKIRLGENNYLINYLDHQFLCALTAAPRTRVAEARRENRDELASAEYQYCSEDIYVAVSKRQSNSGGDYYLTHVIVNDPSQICGALSNDTLGGTRERPSAASMRIEDWIVGVNGSYFGYDHNEPTMYAHVIIHNGTVYRDYESGTTGQEICLRKDGTLFTPETGLSATVLKSQGVVDIWGTCDPVLIERGILSTDLSGRNPGKHPRTGIGMVTPCEYYLLTSTNGNYKGGLDYSECQELFHELGCEYARTLDGGGSSALAFCGRLISQPATGSERPVADFLYFRTQQQTQSK